MIFHRSIWIAAVIAGCHLIFSVTDIKAVQLTSEPGDQVVIVGHNDSHIELKWNIDLQGQSYDRTKIFRSKDSGFSSSTLLYISSLNPKIVAEYQNRLNVTNVVEGGAVTVTLVIQNVTLSDEMYYKVQVEATSGSQTTNTLFLTVYVIPSCQIYTEKERYFENQVIILYSNATGKPAPATISWIQVSNPSRSFPDGSSLTISSANESDAGQYKCVATNSAGSGAAFINITVIPSSVPSIDFVSPNQTILEGITITLHCNASGYPTPTISWTRKGNDSVISTNNGLTLSQVTKEDAGLYICIAVNHMGEDKKNVSVEVQFTPEISQSPQSMIVNESDSTSLFCNASGNPSAEIIWTKEGDENFRETGETLLLTNITKSDAGTYICTASNGIGQNATANATVTVQYKPRGTVIQRNLTNNLVERPAGIKLNCTADAVPVPHVYEFFVNNNKHSESSNGVLELSSDNLPYLSTIKCVPHNRYWTGEEVEINITVHVAPEISQSPQSMIVNESDSEMLFCNASGNPPADIIWTREGDANFRKTGETLLLTSVTKSGRGTYICTASNGIGQNASANTTVTVQYKPRGTVIQSNLTNNVVERPAGIKLNCTADAVPVPHVYEFFVNNNKHSESSNGVLELSSDSLPYLSTIKCVPHNRYWTGEGVEINITIHDKPEITKVTSNPKTWIGKTVTIECEAKGNPRPTIIWSRSKEVVNRITTTYEMQSSLTIKQPTESDFGVYTCIAQNGLGNANKNVTLFQQTTPGAPIIVSADNKGESMIVKWIAPADDGGHAIISYLVTLEDNSGKTETCSAASNETSCVINNIPSSFDTFVITVKAQNGAGYGDIATVRLKNRAVQITFTDEPCDVNVVKPGTKQNEEKSNKFVAEIERVFRDSNIKLYGAKVKELRCGSITAVFDLLFLTNETNYLEPLKKDTEDGKLGTFAVDKTSIKDYKETKEETGFIKFWNSLPLGAKVGFIIALCLVVVLILYMIVMCIIKCRQHRRSSGNLESGIGMKNYSNKAFDTEAENGMVITKKQPQGEPEQRNGDTAPRIGDTDQRNGHSEKRNGEIEQRNGDIEQQNGDLGQRNGHSKQDMQTGEEVKDGEDIAKSRAGENSTLNSTIDLAAISTEADAQNSHYTPRTREWRTDDYLY